MSRLFYHTMQDNLGNLLFGVQGTMRLAGTGTNATIYGDAALTVILPNPMTNHASFGSFKCYLDVGDYDFYMAKAGYTFETLTGIQGLGNMATQDADAVVITGGFVSGLTIPNTAGSNVTGLYSQLQAAGGTNRYFLITDGNAPSLLRGNVQVGDQPALYADAANGRVGIGLFGPILNAALRIHHPRLTTSALWLQPIDTDTGGNVTVQFANTAGTGVGSITCTATVTAYNTSSDGRLKEGAEPLSGAMDVIRALNPVSFRWKADGSLGHGLIAQEVAQVVPGVVSGTEMLGIDYGKLVPWLVSAVKELTQQVEMLTAKLAAASA